MKTVQLSSWFDFEAAVRDLGSRQRELESGTGRLFAVPLFRGLGSAEWGLETTLERSRPLEASEETVSLSDYYRDVCASKPAVETFTERQWEGLPDPPEFRESLREFATLGAQAFFSRYDPIYRYFIYLRHHGFPSPLLDWTASPYVAAFFAFDGMPKDAEFVSIYAMLRDSSWVKSSDKPDITILGPYVRSHKRHLVQQSQYSVCLQWSPDYLFRSHGEAMEIHGVLGIASELSKLNIPARDRGAALKSLDLMNVNAFSLFGSEDSLIRTIARRELLLRHLR
jgi:hypothetical protein